MKRFVTALFSVGLLVGLVGCSDSNEEVADSRTELDKASVADSSPTPSWNTISNLFRMGNMGKGDRAT